MGSCRGLADAAEPCGARCDACMQPSTPGSSAASCMCPVSAGMTKPQVWRLFAWTLLSGQAGGGFTKGAGGGGRPAGSARGKAQVRLVPCRVQLMCCDPLLTWLTLCAARACTTVLGQKELTPQRASQPTQQSCVMHIACGCPDFPLLSPWQGGGHEVPAEGRIYGDGPTAGERHPPAAGHAGALNNKVIEANQPTLWSPAHAMST